MTEHNKSLQAAKELQRQHKENVAFSNLSSELHPTTEDEAYAIQRELFTLRKSDWGDITGYKVALTSEVMQRMLNFPSPFSGPLHANLIQKSGARLIASDYGRLCIECEIAAILRDDLPLRDQPYTRNDIEDAVDMIAPALEIVDDRRADYDHISKEVHTLIADNAWNKGLVHGTLVRDWRQLDLASLQGTVSINGHLTGTGKGADVLGHPFEALAWLTNKVLSQGKIIKSGMTIMTGTMIKTQFVSAGDTLTFHIPELGSVTTEIL